MTKKVTTTTTTTTTTYSGTPSAIVVCLLDETGSMVTHREETVHAYNAYINGLREAQGVDLYLTTLFFDHFTAEPTVRKISEGPIKEIKNLKTSDYNPRGMTPLYDAIGHAISEAERLQKQHSADRVTVMIQTDGAENSSKEFSYVRIKELIARKTVATWEFLFLAADLGASGHVMAMNLGMASGQTMSYNKSMSIDAFAAASQNTASYSSTGVARGFTVEQRAKSGDNTKL